MLYNVIILKPSISFCVIYDYITMTITCDSYCDIMLTPNSKFKIRKFK